LKHQLRHAALHRRKLLSAKARADQSEAITQQALALVLSHPANCIASYESWLSEPDTSTLNQALVAGGKQVIVPTGGIEPGWRDLTSSTTADLSQVDLLLIPALAIDQRGTRLGRGAGWYDRALAAKRPTAPIIALLFNDEYLPTELLPRDPHDIPVDFALIPTGTIAFHLPSQ